MTMPQTMVDAEIDPDEIVAADSVAYLLHGFGDPSRVLILRHLALGEHRVVDLTAHLGLAQSTVSKHLSCLRDCGLVESRPVGRASLFSLRHPEATDALLDAAMTLFSATEGAVLDCPTSGAEVSP